MNYWYLRAPDEIFCDLDGKSVQKHAGRLRMVRRRLVAAIEQGKLQVRDVWFYPSARPLHHHLIVRCVAGSLQRQAAQAWALYLGSDVYRACNNLMREASPLYSASGVDLLIVPELYDKFYRPADFACYCEGKHSPEAMERCKVAIQIRGEQRTDDFFGKPNKDYEVWPHFGKVKP